MVIIAERFTWWISYDYKSLEYCPHYDGRLAIDWYGRLHQAHSNGTVNLRDATNSPKLITDAILQDVKKNVTTGYYLEGLVAVPAM